MDDYIAASEYRTPTVADSLGLFLPLVESDDIELPRSMMHNDDFNRVTLYSSPDVFAKGHAYAPGVLTGIWEGYYMVRKPNSFFATDVTISHCLLGVPISNNGDQLPD